MAAYSLHPILFLPKGLCIPVRLLLATGMLIMLSFFSHANPEFRPPKLQTSNFELQTSNLSAPPNWAVNPAGYQFYMNILVRLSFENAPSNHSGNVVGVFVGTELRGVATPTNIAGQLYYFITVYSNQYSGEALRFRAYYAPNDEMYATPESVSFTHGAIIGALSVPFGINIDPNLDYAPEIVPVPNDTTLQNIPFDPVNLTEYLISFDNDPVTWSAVAGPNLTATLVNGVLTVAPVLTSWTGTDIVTITVTENTPHHYIFTRVLTFTVLPDYGLPVFQPIPPQTIYEGENFSPFDLDNYLNFNGACRNFDFEVFPYTGTAPNPAWPAVPSGPQAMTVVARPLFADQALAGPGAKLAAFVNNVLVGSASPAGTPPYVSYSLSLQNLAAGPVTFRFYHAENQYLYEKTTTLNFTPGASTGNVASPYPIQFSPLLPTLAPNGAVQVTVVDPAWLGAYPVDFIVWDCNYPAARRDTVSTSFTVVVDNRPHLTSPATAGFQENACALLYDAQTTDPNSSEGNGLTYSIAGGADAAKFTIDPGTGHLSWFNFTPDFETPADNNTDSRYEVLIRVTNLMSLTDELALTITVTDSPVESFLPQINGGAVAVCLSAISVDLLASGGNTYLWSNSSTASSITVTAAGTYTVTITGAGGCTGSVTVTVSTRPMITAMGSGVPVCAGSEISLRSTPAGGSGAYTQFAWAGPNGYSAMAEDPAPFPAVSTAAGTYTVTVTDHAGCTASATATVVLLGTSAPVASAVNSGPVCAGANLLLSASVSGGSGTYTHFNWSGPNVFTSSVQNPSGFTATPATAGAYTVTVTDNAGCTATAVTTVQVKNLPAVVATSNSPHCPGAAVQLDASPSGGSGAGYTFLWDGPNGYTANAANPAGFPAALATTGTYTVTVTDNAGCTGTGTTAVSLLNNAPPTINCPANQNIPANGSCVGTVGNWVPFATNVTDDCTAPGAIVVTQLPASSTAISGHNTVQTVILTAEDGAGSTMSCSFQVTVKDQTPPAVSCPANITVAPGIISPCSAVVSGIDAVFGDNCSGASLAYALSGATSGSGNGPASGHTFLSGATTVTYTVTDGAGLSTSCTFILTISNCNTEFSGTIKWEHDGTSGVQTATVNLTGAATGSAVTNASGNYLISIPGITGNFTLKPVKNINKLNGLTSADATAIQQHVTTQALLPGPFKRIAADVNKSNSITTTDASLVNQVLQGNPQANAIFNTSWRFVPASYSFPNPDVPWGFPEQIVLSGVNGGSGQDFNGIKLGDVATTWANPANFGNGKPLVFRVQDQVLEAGADVTAEFRADQLDDLNSFQFTLHFDTEQLQLEEIEPLAGLPVSLENFGTYTLDEGEIRVVWSQATSVLLSEAAPVFRLRFKALENGSLLSEALQMSPEGSELPGLVYNSKYAESGVELRYSKPTDIFDAGAGVNGALRCRPNPFKRTTSIDFDIFRETDTELRITDAMGRILYSAHQYYTAGRHTVVLQLNNANGLLLAELITPFGITTQKLVAVKN